MNLHGSFRSCSTKYTESLACTDGIARLRERKLILEIVLVPLQIAHESFSQPDFDEEYRQPDFYQLFLTGAKSRIFQKILEDARYFFVQICQISITIGTSLRSFFFVTASIPAISKTFTIWTIVSYGRARR